MSTDNRQLYIITARHARGDYFLWSVQSWQLSQDDALAYGRKVALDRHLDEPAAFIRVSAQLA